MARLGTSVWAGTVWQVVLVRHVWGGQVVKDRIVLVWPGASVWMGVVRCGLAWNVDLGWCVWAWPGAAGQVGSVRVGEASRGLACRTGLAWSGQSV